MRRSPRGQVPRGRDLPAGRPLLALPDLRDGSVRAGRAGTRRLERVVGAPAIRLINRWNAVTERRLHVCHLAPRPPPLPRLSCEAEAPVRAAQNGLVEHHCHEAVVASYRPFGVRNIVESGAVARLLSLGVLSFSDPCGIEDSRRSRPSAGE